MPERTVDGTEFEKCELDALLCYEKQASLGNKEEKKLKPIPPPMRLQEAEEINTDNEEIIGYFW